MIALMWITFGALAVYALLVWQRNLARTKTRKQPAS